MYHILAGGMPNFSRPAITSAALVLLNVKAAQYGESMIAALTVSSRVAALAYMIMIGWGQGFFYLPLLYILPALYGKSGIYLLQPFSDVLSFLFAVAVVYRWYSYNTKKGILLA